LKEISFKLPLSLSVYAGEALKKTQITKRRAATRANHYSLFVRGKQAKRAKTGEMSQPRFCQPIL